MRKAMMTSLLAVALLLPASAEARWPNGSGSRLRVDADLFAAVADVEGLSPVDAVLLAAICVHESGHRGVRGGVRREMWGPGQVHWKTWGEGLKAAGIAERPEDLLDRSTGVWAAAFVLRQIKDRYGDLTPQRMICLYACGEKAEQWPSCEYAGDIADNLPGVVAELGEGQASLVAALRGQLQGHSLVAPSQGASKAPSVWGL